MNFATFMCIQMIKYFTANQDKAYSVLNKLVYRYICKQALFLNHSMLFTDVYFRFV